MKIIRRGCWSAVAAVFLLISAPQLAAGTEGWQPLADMPGARLGLGVCAVDGELYAVGGYANANAAAQSLVEIYSPSSDTWRPGIPLPQPRRQFPVASAGNRCYVISGRAGATASDAAVRTVFSAGPTGGWTHHTPIPTARVAAAAATSGDRIYVAGGGPSPANLGGFFEMYDPATDRWTVLPDMPTTRAFPAAAAVGEEIYVLGGTLNGQQTFDHNEVYDLATGQWRAAAPVPTPRHSAVAVVVAEQIYLIGGGLAGGLTTPVVEVFDTVTGSWAEAPALGEARFGHGAGLVEENLIVVGGARAVVPPHPAIVATEGMKVAPRPLSAINFGFTGGWFDPAAPGQGLLLEVLPGAQLFAAWFTFDESASKLADPAHRWLTAQGSFVDLEAELTLYLTRDGRFDAADPAVTRAAGTATLSFTACDEGLFEFSLEGGPAGAMALTRLAADANCAQFIEE